MTTVLCTCGHDQSEHGPIVDYDSDGACYADGGHCPCELFVKDVPQEPKETV